MSQSPPSFHLRLPADLKSQLEVSAQSRGKSLTREMIDRLERTFEPDAAMQLADSLRPFLDKLDDEQRRDAVEMGARLLDLALLVRKPRKR